jgi:hypothetical protein
MSTRVIRSTLFDIIPSKSRHWTPNEDLLLRNALLAQVRSRDGGRARRTGGGPIDWSEIASVVGGRTATQCSYRWYRVLKHPQPPVIRQEKRRNSSWSVEMEMELIKRVNDIFKQTTRARIPVGCPPYLLRSQLSLKMWERVIDGLHNPYTARHKWNNHLYHVWLLQQTQSLLAADQVGPWSPTIDTLLLHLTKMIWPRLRREEAPPTEVFQLINMYFMPQRSPGQLRSRFLNHLYPLRTRIVQKSSNRMAPDTWSRGQIERLMIGLRWTGMDFNQSVPLVNKTMELDGMMEELRTDMSRYYVGRRARQDKKGKSVADARFAWSHMFWHTRLFRP